MENWKSLDIGGMTQEIDIEGGRLIKHEIQYEVRVFNREGHWTGSYYKPYVKLLFIPKGGD